VRRAQPGKLLRHLDVGRGRLDQAGGGVQPRAARGGLAWPGPRSPAARPLRRLRRGRRDPARWLGVERRRLERPGPPPARAGALPVELRLRQHSRRARTCGGRRLRSGGVPGAGGELRLRPDLGLRPAARHTARGRGLRPPPGTHARSLPGGPLHQDPPGGERGRGRLGRRPRPGNGRGRRRVHPGLRGGGVGVRPGRLAAP